MDTLTNAPFGKLSIGIQSFERLRSKNFLYADEVALVYRPARTDNSCFLSCPRRFGKSLLPFSFEAYLRDKKELFRGLAIEKLEKEWSQYPVPHLGPNAEEYDSRKGLVDILKRQSRQWEELYRTGGEGITHSGCFMTVIRRTCGQTERRVVVPIDEYGKPLLRLFDNQGLQHDFREMSTAFYIVLKDVDPWLQSVFVTGATKFVQMGIFSNLSQLDDISFGPDYNTLCGIIHAKIGVTFSPELEAPAVKSNAACRQVMDQLTRRYDGYRFAKDEEFTSTYSPFSVLSALQKRSYGNYWFASGALIFLAKMLQKTDSDLRGVEGTEANGVSLSDDRADINNPISMVYQSGYLTIKDYDGCLRMYTLGFPNEEMKYGFLSFINPFYIPIAQTDASLYIGKLIRELEGGDANAFLMRLHCLFASIPYDLNDRMERHYQAVPYLVFQLMEQFTETEARGTRRCADVMAKTLDYVHVFELGLNDNAEAALRQIDEEEYLLLYQADGRKVVKAGVVSEKEERSIRERVIEE